MNTLDMTLTSALALKLGGKSLPVLDPGDKVPDSLRAMIPDDESAMEDCARVETPCIVAPEDIRKALFEYFMDVGWEDYELHLDPEFMMGTVYIGLGAYGLSAFYEKVLSNAGKPVLCVNILATVC